uniref:Uncharacterized protein n=1 Tax=Peronospora matthiolae TaxID=2874970 RepID=A0AAV1TSX8_9STRA
MEEGGDVLSHINKMITLVEQLDAVGTPVNKEDLVITHLGSLSESFAFLITALDSRADSLSWELVTSRLLNKYMKRKERGSYGVAAGQAFMTGEKKRSGRPFKMTDAFKYCVKWVIVSRNAPRGSLTTRTGSFRSVRMWRTIKMKTLTNSRLQLDWRATTSTTSRS